ncbi:MAG TPA: hypothetical protein VF173_04580 [Thermoanaerobaculia bacterium]|nr:hypothetical protein [Thermoanaerobaculia bacterium]
MSLWAVGAALALFLLLGLLGSRFSRFLASPADGVLYRGVLYVLAGTVLLHLILTLLDFAGVRWGLPVLGVAALAVSGLAAWMANSASAPPPKTLITPALFSRHALTGEEGAPTQQQGRLGQVPLSRGGGSGGRERGRGEGLGWGRSRIGWGEALALFALAVFTVFALSGWIAMPDFVYHWGVKGHRFYLVRGVDYLYLTRSWNWSIHPDYPQLAPELFAVTALFAGRFDMPAMMLGTAVLFALLLAAGREALRQGGADRFTAQAGTALVALVVAAFGIGNVMAGAPDWNLALALTAALPPLLRPPDRAGDLQIGVIAAFAAASKVEGVPLAAFLVAVQIGRRLWAERRLDLPGALAAALPPAAVILPWAGRALHYHLFQELNSGTLDLSRAREIFAAVGQTLQLPAWHGFLAAMFLAPLLLLCRRTRAFAAAATLELTFYYYVYFTTSVGNTGYYVLSNYARLGFQLVPACLVAALVAVSRSPQKSERPAESPPPAAGSDDAPEPQ